MLETNNGQLSLFSDQGRGRRRQAGSGSLSDQDARDFATDPRQNVVLEASAGTGKTSVLVQRFINLLRAGVDPSNVLAITFTRQAAAEMRERIITRLRDEGSESRAGQQRWHAIRDRLSEISVSTVDAFCLSLLREFPLEADLDPGFGMADETEVPGLLETAVEKTLSISARLAREDAGMAMLLAQLGPGRTRAALISLLDRRLVVPAALHRFLAATPQDVTADTICGAAGRRLAERLQGTAQSLELMISAGPQDDPWFLLVADDLRSLSDMGRATPAAARASLDRIREFFLTKQGVVRTSFRGGPRLSAQRRRRFRGAAGTLAPLVHETLAGFDRDLNVVMARAVRRIFGVAVSEYQRELESRAILDFSDVLQRAIELLRQMDEFARSRYRLEARYQHVLVDEFQDTSRAQWELISLLVKAWGEGSGLGDDAAVPPTIFIVGDRKQSIYRFRDADVSILRSAASEIGRLRSNGSVRRSIAHSFRAVPGLLRFINDLFAAIGASPRQPDGFAYEPHDRFPVETSTGDTGDRQPLGLIVTKDLDACAATVAAEVELLLRAGRVRATDGSGERPVSPGDIAILFRARESHREFDKALGRRSIPAYVYKGLGFFDTDEIKDVRALIRFLSHPESELRAAALCRSRFARLSDPTLVALAGRLSAALVGDVLPQPEAQLLQDDRARLVLLRQGLATWLLLVDRLTPAEVLDRVLSDTAYAWELQGVHVVQARENLKKMRALVRKLQNRGYATMARIADQIDHLSGDVATAVVEAFDAVHLMTVHAAKGLEFPVVFLVDLGRGTNARVPAVRVMPDRGDGQPSVAVWPYRSETDSGERDQNIEETKRLLYVASTRARDRLYLSAVARDGRVKFHRGSFGEVFPSGLASAFSAAADHSRASVDWEGPGGVTHQLRIVAHASEERAGVTDAARDVESDESIPRVDLSPLEATDSRRIGVTESLEIGHRERAVDSEVPGEPELVGRTVHQLLQRFLGRQVDTSALAGSAEGLLQRELPLEPDVVQRLARRVVELYGDLSSQAEVMALRPQDCLFEVPFTLLDSGSPGARATPQVVTGVIDCVAREGDGKKVRVLEFKTGVARPEHQWQLEQYVAAAREMFPGTRVEGRLLYPSRG